MNGAEVVVETIPRSVYECVADAQATGIRAAAVFADFCRLHDQIYEAIGVLLNDPDVHADPASTARRKAVEAAVGFNELGEIYGCVKDLAEGDYEWALVAAAADEINVWRARNGFVRLDPAPRERARDRADLAKWERMLNKAISCAVRAAFEALAEAPDANAPGATLDQEQDTAGGERAVPSLLVPAKAWSAAVTNLAVVANGPDSEARATAQAALTEIDRLMPSPGTAM